MPDPAGFPESVDRSDRLADQGFFQEGFRSAPPDRERGAPVPAAPHQAWGQEWDQDWPWGFSMLTGVMLNQRRLADRVAPSSPRCDHWFYPVVFILVLKLVRQGDKDASRGG